MDAIYNSISIVKCYAKFAKSAFGPKSKEMDAVLGCAITIKQYKFYISC